jgi:ANTAR domain/GAF domain
MELSKPNVSDTAHRTIAPASPGVQHTGDVASRIAVAVAEAAATLNSPQTVEERLDAIVRAAPGTVPGFDHVSVSVAHRDGPVETRAASDDLVHELDRVQYQAEEGPCFDAFHRPGVVTAPDLRHEQRWPTYVRRALAAGVTAQMAVHLRDDRVLGSLNLYRTTGQGIDPEAPGLAVLFGTHAALALGRAYVVEQLNTALSTRKTIGQAIGIVMERYQINEAKAFDFMTRVSSTSNIKLREVALELVSQSDTQYTVRDA